MEQQASGIHADVGDNAKNAAIGSDIDQTIREASATGNVVHVYPGPPVAETVAGGEVLMADAAQEIWKAIAKLNQIMGGLTSNVAANTRATERQATSIDSLARTTDNLTRTTEQQGQRAEVQYKEFAVQISSLQRIALALRAMGIQVPDEPTAPVRVRQSPWWQPYATPVLLTAILIVLVVYAAYGGGK